MWSMERFGRQSGQSLNSLWQRFSNSSVTAKGRLLFPAGSFPYLFLFGSLSLAGIISWGRIRQKQRSSLKTAPDVDIARYTGTWFEIARLPAPEEKGAVNIRATYTLRADGRLDILNQCELDGFEGPHREARAVARIPDPADPSRLKVRFGLLTADYWILELGEHYEYAVVGTPNRRRLWILARQPQLRKEVYEGIVARMSELGFALEHLILAPQNVHKPISRKPSQVSDPMR